MKNDLSVIKTAQGTQAVPTKALLQSEGVLFIEGEIRWETSSDFTTAMALFAKKGVRSATVVVCSQGGEVDAGMSIYDAISGFPGEVTTVCLGQAYSMAAVIFAAGKRRVVIGHSKIMIHQPFVTNSKGTADQIGEVLKDVSLRQDEMVRIFQKTCGKTKKEIERAIKNETFFTGDEAVAFGIATEIGTFGDVFGKEDVEPW